MAIFSIQPIRKLPQGQNLKEKLEKDLMSGYRIHGQHPNYMDTIRVWTKTPLSHDPSQFYFIVIATARRNLKHPVCAIEIQAYCATPDAWRMKLIQHPFPEPHWKIEWQTLKNTYPVGVTDPATRSRIVNLYLASEFDIEATQKSYRDSLKRYQGHRLSWVKV